METRVLFLLSSSCVFHIAAEIVQHEIHTANVFVFSKGKLVQFKKKKKIKISVSDREQRFSHRYLALQ